MDVPVHDVAEQSRPTRPTGARAEAREQAILDAALGNLDRHYGNVKVDGKGNLTPIDHDTTLPDQPVSRDFFGNHDPMGQFTGEDGNYMAMEAHVGEKLKGAELRKLDELLKPEFHDQLRKAGLPEASINRMVERVEALKHMGQMPEDPQSFIADPTGRAAWMKPEEIDKLIEGVDRLRQQHAAAIAGARAAAGLGEVAVGTPPAHDK